MLVSNRYWSSTFYIGKLRTPWASLEAQLVKNPPAMQETWVQSLGWEDPLEKGKATHSGILARVAKSRTQLSELSPCLFTCL